MGASGNKNDVAKKIWTKFPCWIWNENKVVKPVVQKVNEDEYYHCHYQFYRYCKYMKSRKFHVNKFYQFSQINKLMTVCSYHVTYAFQSESTHCSCLNVKDLLTQNRRDTWSINDCNGTWIHSHLVCKRTLKHLAKLAKRLSCVVSTYLYGAFTCMFLSCNAHVSEWIHTV